MHSSPLDFSESKPPTILQAEIYTSIPGCATTENSMAHINHPPLYTISQPLPNQETVSAHGPMNDGIYDLEQLGSDEEVWGHLSYIYRTSSTLTYHFALI